MAATVGVTLLLIGVALMALACVVILPILLAILPLGPVTTLLIAGVLDGREPRAGMAFGVVYRYEPNRRHARSGWLTGALVGVAI